MFGKLFDSNEKQLNKILPLVEQINSFEKEFEKLKDEDIKAKTQGWKDELKGLDHEKQDQYLENILPEAFALVKEATKRTEGITLHDVQLIAGITLHQGKITEQKTGEGKTMVICYCLLHMI